MGRIRGWWNSQNQTTRQILIVLVVIALVSSVAGVALTNGDFGGLLLNFGTEMGGAVVTFVLITQIVGGTEERERLKRELIMQMGSRMNNTALSAVDELRARRWVTNGALKEAHLVGANLQGAPLELANLEGADLRHASLQGAVLRHANLQGARLIEAKMQGADLIDANLQGALLFAANLQGALLFHAHLQGAHLNWANLQEAHLIAADLQGMDLTKAIFSENTVLPDGTKWTPDTDMAYFTDPGHDPFWRPEPGSVWWYRKPDGS